MKKQGSSCASSLRSGTSGTPSSRARSIAAVSDSATPSLESELIKMQTGAFAVAEPTTVLVPMRDGVRLATDIFRPMRDGALIDEPLPVVLVRTPYDKTGMETLSGWSQT